MVSESYPSYKTCVFLGRCVPPCVPADPVGCELGAPRQTRARTAVSCRRREAIQGRWCDQNRRRTVKGSIGTGSLRCANRKHRADGPSPHGFIQQTRPGAGVLRRDREAATTPHGRGPVVHSPHHAVTASGAKRPSPGVARPKSHGSRQRRQWIASLRSQRRLVFNLATVSSNGIGRNGRCELATAALLRFFAPFGCARQAGPEGPASGIKPRRAAARPSPACTRPHTDPSSG